MHVGPGDSELIHQGGGIFGPDIKIVALKRPIGLAAAAKIEVDDAEMLGEKWRRILGN